MFTNDTDYVVEEYIKPHKVRKRIINDERADLLGNFDDDDKKFMKKAKKSKPIVVVSEENPFADGDDSDNAGDGDGDGEDQAEDEVVNGSENENDPESNETDNDDDDDDDKDEIESDEDSTNDAQNSEGLSSEPEQEQKSESESEPQTTETEKVQPKLKNKKLNKSAEKSQPKPEKKLNLTDDQIQALIRGCSKKDRFVLYVTNLNYSTTRETLTDFFSVAGTVKSVRVPKVRRSAFAFVEMGDINGFKNALALHNRTLDNYTIKVQISEAGKKKSANKKNILKQKNRKLAEMRNETKRFERSGKGFDKTIKKEINQRKMQMNRRLAKKQAKKK